MRARAFGGRALSYRLPTHKLSIFYGWMTKLTIFYDILTFLKTVMTIYNQAFTL